MNLEGVGAIVTGGASGLGAATARELAKGGARVALFDLNEDLGRELAGEIDGLFVKVDVSNEDDVQAGLEKAVAAFAPIRVLVNCAGIAIGEKTTAKGTPHDLGRFSKTIQVNLIGTFNAIRVVATHMVATDPAAENERGVIVNTASVAAFDGQIGQVAYSASKGGVVGMTLPIARDLARDGVRVCTIAPGLFQTPMMDTLPENIQESLAAMVPFPHRLGRPEEYGRLARHICENTMLNGEVIRLDGAIRMQPK
ncbi:MAG: 3-hydroxyacyl-CoA dehydrogenase [Sphingomonadales bacterium]